MYRCIILLLAVTPVGCIVTQPQSTPVEARRMVEPRTRADYWLYVPSSYDDQDKHRWPMVVTLHGASLYDSSESQIREWKYLAEQKGFIVVAPSLKSAANYILSRDGWMKDLARDERVIMAIISEVRRRYKRIDGERILLTGFREGGYALYYVGLRNSGAFQMLIARDCHTDRRMLASIHLDEQARKLAMVIFNGKDGWGTFSSQGWMAFRYLREHGCFNVRHKELRGGQLRRPAKTYGYWLRYAPKPSN